MWKFISNLLLANKSDRANTSDVKFLIIGLGNIGLEYHNTRHNIGFAVADHIAAQREANFSSQRYGSVATFRFKGRSFVILKPATYMNLSGKAVHYWMQKENIERKNILVIVDDLSLPLGTLRLKASGSSGGHNGLESIISVLGTVDFPRLRFGIGSDFHKGGQVQYVLGKWSNEETSIINPIISECHDLVINFATIGIQRTMNLFNKKST